MIANDASQPVLDGDDMPDFDPADDTRFEDGWSIIPAPKRSDIQLYLDDMPM